MTTFSKLEMLAIQDAVSNSDIHPEAFRQRLLDKIDTSEPMTMVATDLWDDNLTAWEGEEGSVKEEHSELIERLQHP